MYRFGVTCVIACLQQLTFAADHKSSSALELRGLPVTNTRLNSEADDAKIFLLSRVTEEAQTEQVALTDFEMQVLGFEEAIASPADLAAMEKFDQQNDSDAFEAKVARLVKKAYQRDKRINGGGQWHTALQAVRTRDFYLLMMIERAEIKVPRPSLWRSMKPSTLVLYAILVLMAAVGALIAFTELGARLLHSDASRFVFYVLWVALLFGIGEMTRRVQFK